MTRPGFVPRALARTAIAIAPLIALIPAATTSAVTIAPGTYQLHNHPAGEAGPPGYGLRLDEFISVTPFHDVYTFDFDHEDAAMFMDYDGTTIHIYGTAFGGYNDQEYHPDYSGLLTLDFTFSAVTTVPGDDDLHVIAENYSNSGSASLDGVNAIQRALYDYSGGFGYTFRLGDENNDLGHRDFAGISGWGWMSYTNSGPVQLGLDWLFTATPVPGPSALAAMALVMVLPRRRR